MGSHPTWDLVRRHLEDRRRPVEEEIRRYPPPIAGCDAQFNYLLEQRSQLSRELVRLAAASRGPDADTPEAVEAFVRSSPCIDAAAAEVLRARAALPA
jgi:hypothetical protein